MKHYQVPASLAVGLEGFWGLILSCIFLPLLQNLPVRLLPDHCTIRQCLSALTSRAHAMPAVVHERIPFALASMHYDAHSLCNTCQSTKRTAGEEVLHQSCVPFPDSPYWSSPVASGLTA